MNRLELLSFFEKRDIETRHIPPDVLERARKVVERIEGGESYLSVHGKRLVLNHRRISIPLGRKWRLLADEEDDQLSFRAVMSHQTYDSYITFA